MHILVFGDSITQGFHDDEKGGWAARLFSHCVKESIETDYEKYVAVFNLGISGERSCDLVRRFDSEFATREDSDMVTLFAIGTNDSARNIATQENWCAIADYQQNLSTMIAAAKAKGKVVLVGLPGLDESVLNPIPWFSEYAHLQADRDRYDAALQHLSSKHDCLYIKTEDIFANMKEELLTDGLHPNAEGHRLIYGRVKTELENADIL